MPQLAALALILAPAVFAAAPPTAEEVEAATGLTVVGTSKAKGKLVGPSTFLFQEPVTCPLEDGAREVDARADPELLHILQTARAQQDEANLPVELRGMKAWLFRLDADGVQLWLQITELPAHELPRPTLYAHGLLQRCQAHKAFDLRLEHAGRHWQFEGPCTLSSRRATALAKTLEAQLDPTWLTASPCGGMSPLDKDFMESAGIDAQPIIEVISELGAGPREGVGEEPDDEPVDPEATEGPTP